MLLDDRRPAYPPGAAGDEALEQAVEVAASVVVASRRAGFPVGLSLVSGAALGAPASADAAQLLDALAGVVAVDAPAPDAMAAAALRARRDGGSCVALVSGEPAADDLARLATLRGTWDRVVALCVRPTGPGTAGGAARGVTLLQAPTAAELVARWSLEGAR